MSIQGILGTTPSTTVYSDTTEAASRTRAARSDDSSTTTSETSSSSKPVRFPWLSRLSAQLSAASKTPTTFAAPVLGDNLDKQA